MFDLKYKMYPHERRFIAALLVICSIIAVDVIIASAFPIFESMVLNIIGLYTLCNLAVKLAKDTKTYDDFTK